jgi:hypothetical protein
MNLTNPFETEGNWYKGNLHSHTTNSDGEFTPEEMCRIYRDSRYDFLCITDHNKITKTEDVENITLIQGAEMGTGYEHIVAVDLKEEFNPENLSSQEIIDNINHQDAIAIVAHPYWSAITGSDLLSLEGYAGIEVYNNLCQRIFGKGYSTVQLDEILKTGRKTLGFASDDTHSRGDLTTGFIMVKSPSSQKEDLLKSIKGGYFYSSTGVIIKDFLLENFRKIKIRFTPATTVDFIAYIVSGKRITAGKNEMEYAEYEIKGDEKYLRIEITDRNNRKAWLNPVLF